MSTPTSKRSEVQARNRAALNKANPKRHHSNGQGGRDDDASKPGLNVRRTVLRLLNAIVDTRTSFDALTDDHHGHPNYLALEARDRALLRAILMVALRRRADLDAVIADYVEKPLPAGATALTNLLHIALAQIFFLDVPDHSAVDLAVECANRDPRLKRFASLINAVTRRAVRQKEKTLAKIESSAPCSSPWFTARMVDVYGQALAEKIEQAHRLPAPLDFTVKDDADAEKWASLLEGELLPTGSIRRASDNANVVSLPGFDDGAWWVQDAAAAVPAKMFGDLSGKRALDLCAAPGGKTAQLAAGGAQVTALDMSANRLKRLNQNLTRLGLAERCTTVTTSLFEFEFDEKFDVVLLDAPCSSTGTVRRHPDVPWTKTPEDVAKLAELQARMLDKAADFVAPGGLLVFSNCSLDPLEGEDVAQAFSEGNAAFQVVRAEIPGLETCVDVHGFVRTTPADLVHEVPAMSGMDGFFAAMFRRQ